MQERDIKTMKFMKRFEGKMRYINKESGLLGALFPNQNIENVQTNRVPVSKHEIIELISQAKRIKRNSINREKIRSHREFSEKTEKIRESIEKLSKPELIKERVITLPRIHTNVEDKENSQDKQIRYSNSSSHSENSGRRRSVSVRIR